MALSASTMPVRVGLTPTPVMVIWLSGTMDAGDQEKGGRRDVARHVDVERGQRLSGRSQWIVLP